MEFEISLTDLLFYSYHGVMEEENHIGNEFKVNLKIIIPYKKEMNEDQLQNTISYTDLYKIITEEMAETKKLMETVAFKIGERIKKTFPEVKSGEIKIEKRRPPIPGMLGTASVALRF